MKVSNKVLIVLMLCISFVFGCSKEIPVDEDLANSVSMGKSKSVTTSAIQTTTIDITTTSNTTTQATTVEETSSEEVTTTETTIFGYPLSEINSIANDLYNQACNKYRGVLIECSYGVDLYNSIMVEGGKRYYYVNNPYYPNVESVLEDWHTVFNSNFDDLVCSKYLMHDDGLYAYTAIQQVNTNYSDTVLKYYYLEGENILTFKATCNYSSGEKVFKFSIEYNPETDEWRVSEFTMPY